MNLLITQTTQPTFTVEVVQNLVPVITAQVVIGGNGGGTANIEFGDTMTGTGTHADPVNVSNDILDQIQDNTSQIAGIQETIPATANAQNQLADQGFVNSSIQTATAYFRGDWATWADVPSDPELYPVDATGNHTPTTNDYLVVIADEQENGGTWRYKYTGVWSEQGKSGWLAEYQVNETPLTAAQLAALNSGVTAQKVADITSNKNAITGLQTSKQDKLTAGTGITIEGDTISAPGGDFLPLSGGTLRGVLKVQSGQGTGALWVGADVNNTTLTNNRRHLARIVVPSFTNTERGATLLGWDSSGDTDVPIANNSADVVGFGGSKKITNATSPMGISFCVTKVRESTAAADKIYALAMDANNAIFGVQPSYNGANLTTTSDVANAIANTVGDISSVLDAINGEAV